LLQVWPQLQFKYALHFHQQLDFLFPLFLFAFFSAASLAFFFVFSAADILAQGLSSGINSAAAAATAAA